jgi:hypothetical protein
MWHSFALAAWSVVSDCGEELREHMGHAIRSRQDIRDAFKQYY